MLKKELAPAIGKRIREERIAKGMSQAELAAKVDSKFYNVSNWELGKYVPSTGVLVNVATALGVTYEYLIGQEKKPSLETGLKGDDCTPEEFGAMLDKARGIEAPSKAEEPVLSLRSDCVRRMLNYWKPVDTGDVAQLMIQGKTVKAVDFDEEEVINLRTVTMEELLELYLDKKSGYVFFVKEEKR